MELTLDAMAYDLWLTIRNGHVVDDDDLDIRQIKFWIKNNRAVWVKNEVGKGYSLSQRFIQPVKTGVYDYVSLIPTDIAQFGTVGDTILKTTIQIPNLIEYKGTPLLTKVGPALVNEGTFTIIRFKRVMPHILDVPNFKGVRIHAGNTRADTEGCILLGSYGQEGMVIESKVTTDRFNALITDVLDNGEDIWITVDEKWID